MIQYSFLQESGAKYIPGFGFLSKVGRNIGAFIKKRGRYATVKNGGYGLRAANYAINAPTQALAVHFSPPQPMIDAEGIKDIVGKALVEDILKFLKPCLFK